MEEWSGQREALPEFMKDCIDAVNFYLLYGLPKSPSEVPYGFLFLLYYGLQRTNIPLFPHKEKVPRDEYCPKLVERVPQITRELVEPS